MEAINKFLKKEIDYKMFDRNVLGIKYWEYVRVLVSCEVNSIISGSSPMFARKKFNLRRYFISIKHFKNYFLKKKEYDILVISQARRVYDNGRYKNNYTDYYVDFLCDKYDIKTLEEPSWSSFGSSDKAHDLPTYIDDIYFTDIHELLFLIKKILYRFIKREKYKKILNEYLDVKAIINSWYGTEHKDIEFKKHFVDSLIRLDIDKKFVRTVLKKISPKLVLIHYMPSLFKQMIINECNNHGITTVEIQHGTITKVDPIVNKCLNVDKVNNDTKYIFSFGENQVNKYNLSIKNKKNVINVGFPFFEKILNENKNKKHRKKYVLIISQSTIGDEMAEFASELSYLLKNTKYKIVFKYHPNEFSKNYNCLKKKNIIEIKREKTIYDIQKKSILQIGAYSTSLYEGFALKVPTLIVDTMFGAIETFDIFSGIKKGIYFIQQPKDVLNYIDKNDIIPLEKDIKKLWQLNSKIRIVEEVKKILEKNRRC